MIFARSLLTLWGEFDFTLYLDFCCCIRVGAVVIGRHEFCRFVGLFSGFSGSISGGGGLGGAATAGSIPGLDSLIVLGSSFLSVGTDPMLDYHLPFMVRQLRTGLAAYSTDTQTYGYVARGGRSSSFLSVCLVRAMADPNEEFVLSELCRCDVEFVSIELCRCDVVDVDASALTSETAM